MSRSLEQSFKVATTLAAQRIVGLNGTAETVAAPASNQILPVGITVDTVLDTNQAIAVAMPGSIAKVYFNDTVSAGALVASDSSGRAIPFTQSGTATAAISAAYVGVLVGSAVAATGTIANILIAPGFTK